MNGGIYVYSISNIPNDAEQDFEWNLYAKSITELEGIKLDPKERVTGGKVLRFRTSTMEKLSSHRIKINVLLKKIFELIFLFPSFF